ncbi:uncharacterized protein LOC112566793 isoform X2 [Pomacea canaliculata]|uniref:uncharacterized protein LOC112566793 isoform X1 n=1 Tax=Pomacea canaliculata TaxID=400727 RepID=UPI000D738F8E|nr:uncharacterized protein LOC112566793 isoform X1 [Pomacea canaliculata]XP_025098943.1 uncharacterized protein LOC112566793 isoform X2 [Pomacea canaliculata]
MLLMLLVALALGSVLADEYSFPVNCEEPRLCTDDRTPYCIKGRREPVRGHCEFQDALCRGEKEDPSNTCFLPYPIRCDRPPDERACVRDCRPWCVVGRSEPLRGHCAIQRAICDEYAVVDRIRSCLP